MKRKFSSDKTTKMSDRDTQAKTSDSGEKKTEWTKERAEAVQSAEARKNDGKIEKGSHAAKAQSRADKNENT